MNNTMGGSIDMDSSLEGLLRITDNGMGSFLARGILGDLLGSIVYDGLCRLLGGPLQGH